MKLSNLYLFVALASTVALCSCGRAGGEFVGREYMPDMAHSIAYEANHYVYYSFNTHGGEAAYHESAAPGLPVVGTIPYSRDRKTVNASMTFPVYHFPNTDEGRAAAMASILENPLRVANAKELEPVLDQGKLLYDINCAICHGEKGDGNGKLYNNGSGPYPAKPANYLDADFMAATDGRFYHAIMHGKGQMLSHADKLSHDERWMVIHYIRSLQATSKKEEYLPFGKKATVAPTLIREANIEASIEKLLSARAEAKDAAAKKAAKELAVELKVLFATASDVIDPSSEAELVKLVEVLTKYTDLKIEIGGHTDTDGDAKANKTLSESRAKAVMAYLTSKGVDAKRLSSKGYGSVKPTSDNDTDEGKALNRRIEIKILD